MGEPGAPIRLADFSPGTPGGSRRRGLDFEVLFFDTSFTGKVTRSAEYERSLLLDGTPTGEDLDKIKTSRVDRHARRFRTASVHE